MREIDHEAKVKRKGERKRGGKGGGRTGQDRERERRGKRILWEMEEQGARGGGGEWWRWCEGFPSTSVIGARSSSLNYIICERPGCHGQNVLPAERKLFLLPRQAPVNYINFQIRVDKPRSFRKIREVIHPLWTLARESFFLSGENHIKSDERTKLQK